MSMPMMMQILKYIWCVSKVMLRNTSTAMNWFVPCLCQFGRALGRFYNMPVIGSQILLMAVALLQPKNDIDMLRATVKEAVDSGLNVVRLPDSMSIVQDGSYNNSWIVEDAITQKLIDRHVRVVRTAPTKLHYRIVDMRVSYSVFRRSFFGPQMAVRTFYIDITFKLVRDGEVGWIRSFEVMHSDTVPLRMLADLRYDGISPQVPETMSVVEPVIIVIALGYILFYLYSGGK